MRASLHPLQDQKDDQHDNQDDQDNNQDDTQDNNQDDQDDNKDNDEGRDAAIVESRWSGDEQQGFTRPVHFTMWLFMKVQLSFSTLSI